MQSHSNSPSRSSKGSERSELKTSSRIMHSLLPGPARRLFVGSQTSQASHTIRAPSPSHSISLSNDSASNFPDFIVGGSTVMLTPASAMNGPAHHLHLVGKGEEASWPVRVVSSPPVPINRRAVLSQPHSQYHPQSQSRRSGESMRESLRSRGDRRPSPTREGLSDASIVTVDSLDAVSFMTTSSVSSTGSIPGTMPPALS
jgi:hypothetical protein